MVDAGALPKAKLDAAKRDLEDAEDGAILERTLYGEVPSQAVSDGAADQMVEAAQRRVARQMERYTEARNLVDGGLTAESSLTQLADELNSRQITLRLAHSRARLISQLAALSRFQQTMASVENMTRFAYRDRVLGGFEHYQGAGSFSIGRDLSPLEAAFSARFGRRLPISAEGATGTHRALGFDHRGRVDVAVMPDGAEGEWLREYLRARSIPYYAFARAVPGKATAAHIHIGPGSTRLHNMAMLRADQAD